MSRTLSEIIEDASEELQDWIDNNPGNDEPHDIIMELADSNTPIYYSDILQMAANNISLALDEPEIGPAFDGSPNPINIIAANIYEAIVQGLWEYFDQHKDDRLEVSEVHIYDETLVGGKSEMAAFNDVGDEIGRWFMSMEDARDEAELTWPNAEITCHTDDDQE